MSTFHTHYPFTGEVEQSFQTHSKEEIQDILNASARAFEAWSVLTVEERCGYFVKMADLLRERSEELAKAAVREMGKPLKQARAEVAKCAWLCDFYADKSPEFLKPEYIRSDASESYVRFDPLGGVFGIMPWNFPFWQVFRFAVPAMTAGNTALLKHADNTTRCGLLIESLFREAGFPENTFRTLILDLEDVPLVIAHDAVAAVTLTGSERAGSAVAALAGKHIKKTVLELGGSDPFIILSDAVLTDVIQHAVLSRTMNNGQSCIAAKRFIVHESLYPEFLEMLKNEFEKLKVGDPMQESTEIGPLARPDLAEGLEKQVADSIKAGAKALTGAKRDGNIYFPTILTDIQPGMPAFEQELFGPVASVFSFSTEDEALALANATEYGLGASVWTQKPREASRMAEGIRSGSVFFNSIVKSDPRLPFGGIKKSGYGRELSHYGIREFVNAKTVYTA